MPDRGIRQAKTPGLVAGCQRDGCAERLAQAIRQGVVALFDRVAQRRGHWLTHKITVVPAKPIRCPQYRPARLATLAVSSIDPFRSACNTATRSRITKGGALVWGAQKDEASIAVGDMAVSPCPVASCAQADLSNTVSTGLI